MSELTVKELIEKLTAVKNKKLPVFTEGCDCTGTKCNIRFEKDCVYITRDDRGPTDLVDKTEEGL